MKKWGKKNWVWEGGERERDMDLMGKEGKLNGSVLHAMFLYLFAPEGGRGKVVEIS